MLNVAGMIDLIQEQLEAYRRTGRPVHLAHAARALNEALAVLPKGGVREAADVGAAYHPR
jgi:hypothetical protein